MRGDFFVGGASDLAVFDSRRGNRGGRFIDSRLGFGAYSEKFGFSRFRSVSLHQKPALFRQFFARFGFYRERRNVVVGRAVCGLVFRFVLARYEKRSAGFAADFRRGL